MKILDHKPEYAEENSKKWKKIHIKFTQILGIEIYGIL